jgi:hypothetical protein
MEPRGAFWTALDQKMTGNAGYTVLQTFSFRSLYNELTGSANKSDSGGKLFECQEALTVHSEVFLWFPLSL